MASSIGNLFKSLCLIFLNAECYTEFFVKYNFTNATCLKSAASKFLGYSIIGGSLIIKVPQILKIWKAKNGEGISLVSVLLDLTAISSSVCYSLVNKYPFSSWGEGLFLMLQTYAIAALIFAFSPRPRDAGLFTAIFVGSVGILLSGAVPLSVLTTLQVLNVPIIVVGKVDVAALVMRNLKELKKTQMQNFTTCSLLTTLIKSTSLQIIANFKNGSTGQLSAVTVFMMFGGSVARVFTSQQETGDALLVFTYLCAATLNGTVVAQLVYYWNAPSKKVPVEGKESADKKKVKKN